MERTKISQLGESIGKKVLLKGFIHEIRDQSKVKFIILRDNSGLVQLVALPENRKVFEKIAKIPRESVISLEGTVKKQKQALPLGLEVHIDDYEVLSEASVDIPIQVVEKGEPPALPTRLDWRWIDLRKPQNTLVFKVWTLMESAFREYWTSNDYIEIHSPKLISTASESGEV